MDFEGVDSIESNPNFFVEDLSQLFSQIEDLRILTKGFQNKTELDNVTSIPKVTSEIFQLDYEIKSEDFNPNNKVVLLKNKNGKRVQIKLSKKRRVSSIYYDSMEGEQVEVMFESNPSTFRILFKQNDKQNGYSSNRKTLETQFINGKLSSRKNKPAIVFQEVKSNIRLSKQEEVWMNQGVRHDLSGPAYILQGTAYTVNENGFARDGIKQSYFYGNHVTPQVKEDFKSQVVNKSKSFQDKKRKKTKPSLFRRKAKELNSDNSDILFARKILLDNIADNFKKLGSKRAEIEQNLHSIDSIIDEELHSLYGQVVYDDQNQEIIINQELLEELQLYNPENIKQMIWDEYFLGIKQKIENLDTALNGVLKLIYEHQNKPLGINMANPDIMIKYEDLKFADISQWLISDTDIQLESYLQNSKGEVYMFDQQGEVDTQSMTDYLVIEQTFTNEDLYSVNVKIQEDYQELQTYAENIEESLSLVKNHMKETISDIKLTIIQHINGTEKKSFYSKELLKEYLH